MIMRISFGIQGFTISKAEPCGASCPYGHPGWNRRTYKPRPPGCAPQRRSAAPFSSEKSRCWRSRRPEKRSVFFLSEGQRTHAAHAVLANHLAGPDPWRVQCHFLPGGLAIHEDLLGTAATHQDGELGFEVILGDGCACLLRANCMVTPRAMPRGMM